MIDEKFCRQSQQGRASVRRQGGSGSHGDSAGCGGPKLLACVFQVLQLQLEDRGRAESQVERGRELEAQLAEMGEVLEGVEEERDALQQQVDRLEASVFQSANQTRQVEENILNPK